MLEGVDDKELEAYMEEHPRIEPLFEIDVMEAAAEYAIHKSTQDEAYEPDPASLMEFHKAQEALEKEMEISRRVKTVPWHGSPRSVASLGQKIT